MPAGEAEFSAAPSPVRSVMYAMVIGAGDAAAVVAAAPNATNGKLGNTPPVVKRGRRDVGTSFPPRFCGKWVFHSIQRAWSRTGSSW